MRSKWSNSCYIVAPRPHASVCVERLVKSLSSVPAIHTHALVAKVQCMLPEFAFAEFYSVLMQHGKGLLRTLVGAFEKGSYHMGARLVACQVHEERWAVSKQAFDK